MSISRLNTSGNLQVQLDRLVTQVNKALAAQHDNKGKRLTNVSRPVAAGDAVPLSYMQQYVEKLVDSAVSTLGTGTTAMEDLTYETLAEPTITGELLREWQSDGSLRLYCDRDSFIGYAPGYVGLNEARYIGEFQGVNVFWEVTGDPDSPVSLGQSEYTGNPQADPPANLGEVDVIIPRGKIVVGDNYLHLRPYGDGRRLRYKPHTSAPNLTYWTVTITQDDLDDNPPDTPAAESAAPTNVITYANDYPGNQVKYGASWTLPADPSGNSGYEVMFEFYNDAGGLDAYYSTYAGWVEGGYITTFWVQDPQSRDVRTVYVRAYVRATGTDLATTDWVAGTIVAVTPTPSNAGPGPFAVAITVDPVAEGPAHYYVNSTLTPPDPLNGAAEWEEELGFFDAASGGNQTYPWTPLGQPISIYDTNELHGPFVRDVPDPDNPPYAQVRARLILGTGAKTDWVLSNRVEITKASGPVTTLVNQSTLTTDTINGKPSYRIHKELVFSGSKLGVHDTTMKIWFWQGTGTNTATMSLDGEIDIGGVDPLLFDTWPATSTQETDWWDRPDYNVVYRIGGVVRDAARNEGTWAYTSLGTMLAVGGFDPAGIDTTKLGTTLLVGTDGKLSNYALTYLDKWGLSTNNFGTSGGNVILNYGIIDTLLSRSITLSGEMLILDGTSANQVRLNSSGVLIGSSSQYVDITSTGITIKGGGSTAYLDANGLRSTEIVAQRIVLQAGASGTGTSYAVFSTSGILLDEGIVTYGTIYCNNEITCAKVVTGDVKCDGTFTHTSGNGVSLSATAKANWRTALGLSTATISYLDHGTNAQTMVVAVYA